MTFQVYLNEVCLPINTVDFLYCDYSGELYHSKRYARWFDILEGAFNLLGDQADHETYFAKAIGLKRSHYEFTAKQVAHGLLFQLSRWSWTKLPSKANEVIESIQYYEDVIDWLFSLDGYTFCVRY